jgi:hypothetical protein
MTVQSKVRKEGYIGVSPQLGHHTSRLRFLQFTSTGPIARNGELPLTSLCRDLVIARCAYPFKDLGVASGTNRVSSDLLRQHCSFYSRWIGLVTL